MSAIQRFINGFGFVSQGFGLIFKPGVKRFVVIPLLVNIILFSIAIWYGYTTIGGLVDKATGWLPGWLDWLVSIVWPLVTIAALIVIYYTFTLLGNLIAAPFNSLLSTAIEKHLGGNDAGIDVTIATLPKIAGRTIWSEIRKLLYQFKWIVVLLILSVIPGLNLLAPFAWFYFGAWMLAINYVDYPMGNHDLYFSHVKLALKKDKITALGLGSGILLLTLIPGMNFLAMPIGVASGTAYFTQAVKN